MGEIEILIPILGDILHLGQNEFIGVERLLNKALTCWGIVGAKKISNLIWASSNTKKGSLTIIYKRMVYEILCILTGNLKSKNILQKRLREVSFKLLSQS